MRTWPSVSDTDALNTSNQVLLSMSLNSSNIKKFKNGNIIPLSKWDKVSNDFDSNKPLDPIKVKPFKQTDYYEVIDGRHRCMVSHHNGHTHVPCNVYEEL